MRTPTSSLRGRRVNLRFTGWLRSGVAVASTLLLALGTGWLAPIEAAAVKDPPAVSIPARYLAQTLSWHKCDFSDFAHDVYPGAPVINCATIKVPMDWQHPDAHPDITLAIAYSRATGTNHRLLTSNPGGPGVAGLRLTFDTALRKTRMFTDFDLLGFDPRGFGDSQNLECLTTVGELRALPEVSDPRVRSAKTHRAEKVLAQAYAKACAETELSQFINTQQTVHDLEFLRQYLGHGQASYDKLNYLGYSYGTWLGAWYADTYPSHTGRFLLDANMNWTSTMYANQKTDSFSFERRRDKMFYPWVARHNATFGLGTTAAKVAKRYEKIRARLGRAWNAGLFVTSPVQADSIILSGMYRDDYFPAAAENIVRLDAEAAGTLDSAGRRQLVAASRRASESPDQNYFARLLDQRRRLTATADETVVTLKLGGEALRCNDTAYSHNADKLLKRADQDAKKYPFIGYDNSVSMCTYWKYPPTPRKVDLTGAPRLLMLQTEGDPATAYEGARAAHQATSRHTRLVSVDNEGQHTLYTDGLSACAEKVGDQLLFDGLLPAKDKTCSTVPLPNDTKVYSLKGPLNGKSYSLK